MLCAKNQSGEIVFAQQAKERSRYFCPHCQNEVILKRGVIKVAHFSHKVSSTTYCQKQETVEHFQLKYQLAQWLRLQGHHVNIEPYVASCFQYPDLIVNGTIAIEIQFSRINIKDVVKRSNGLLKSGYHIIWIIKNPHYNGHTHTLTLSDFERTFIDVTRRELVAWDTIRERFYLYSDIQYVSGKRFLAIRKYITLSQLIQLFDPIKRNSYETMITFKLSEIEIKRYLLNCRKQFSVLEPTLSVMYQLQLSDRWVYRHVGYIFPEQIFIKSHPVFWQLQLLNLLINREYDVHVFEGLINFNRYYINTYDKEIIIQKIVDRFVQIYRTFKHNDVQNNC